MSGNSLRQSSQIVTYRARVDSRLLAASVLSRTFIQKGTNSAVVRTTQKFTDEWPAQCVCKRRGLTETSGG